MKLKKYIPLVVVLAVVFLTHDWVARHVLVGLLAGRTGHAAEVGRADVRLLSCGLHLRGLRLDKDSPSGGDRLLELEHLDVNTRWGPLLKGQFRAQAVSVDVTYLHFVRDADGTTNLDRLAGRLFKGKPEPAPAPAPAAPPPPESAPAKSGKKASSWHIDNLDLRIGQVELTDYARGSPPTQLTLTLNKNRSFQNVSSVDDVLQALQDEFLGDILQKQF